MNWKAVGKYTACVVAAKNAVKAGPVFFYNLAYCQTGLFLCIM